jgi:hypothetical protein
MADRAASVTSAAPSEKFPAKMLTHQRREPEEMGVVRRA